MSRIVELIKTPEWWFSAVFIAIIAGIIAAFAKDWISRALSTFSSFYRTRRLSRQAKLDEEAEMLAAHPELSIIEFIRTVGQEIAILALAAILLAAPFLIQATASGKPKATHSILDSMISALVALGAFVLVLLLFYGMYRNTQKVDLCLRARRKLRDRPLTNRDD
jgi:ABC-type dipeptide/oligopeptide/nickel transport system permease component